MKFILFIFIFSLTACHDNLTLNQVIFNENIKYKITIEGHIKNPGLYLMNKGDLLYHLIKRAGGYKKDAQTLSNGMILKDNMRIFINSIRINNKINLNTTSSIELVQIKGIGPSLADKIITYRQKYGNFKSISDLKNIKGIKEKLFNKIYEYFIV